MNRYIISSVFFNLFLSVSRFTFLMKRTFLLQPTPETRRTNLVLSDLEFITHCHYFTIGV